MLDKTDPEVNSEVTKEQVEVLLYSGCNFDPSGLVDCEDWILPCSCITTPPTTRTKPPVQKIGTSEEKVKVPEVSEKDKEDANSYGKTKAPKEEPKAPTSVHQELRDTKHGNQAPKMTIPDKESTGEAPGPKWMKDLLEKHRLETS